MLSLVFIGNLTANPETRFVDTANGQQTVCNFTVAVNRVVRGQKATEYYRVSCWNKQADNAAKYLHKGSKVCITASTITARAYTDRNGDARKQRRKLLYRKGFRLFVFSREIERIAMYD